MKTKLLNQNCQNQFSQYLNLKGKIFKVLIFLLVLFSFSNADAADRYWVGGAGNWNDASHWSASSGGSSGSSVPGSSDVAIFDMNSGSGTVTVDVSIAIRGLNLATGYSGTIDASNQNVTIGISGFIQNAGTFSAPGVEYWMTIAGNFTSLGGNFDHNNGNLRFNDAGHITFTPGTFNFKNITIAVNNLFNVLGTSISSPLNITGDLNILSAQVFGAGITNVNGDLSINNIQAITGAIDLKGNMFSSDISFTSQGIVTFSSTGNQNVTTIGNAMLPGIRINKPSGIFDLSSVNNTNLIMAGSFINLMGTVSPTTFASIKFNDAGHITFTPGSLTFGNVTVAVSNLFNVTGTSISSPLIITGDLNILSAQAFNAGITNVSGNLSINNIQSTSGTINLKGNMISTDNLVSGFGAITLNGTGDQHINTLNADLSDGLLSINKPSGIVFLDADLTLNGTGQDILVQSGALHLNGFDIIVPDFFTLKPGAILHSCGNMTSLGGESKIIFEPGSIVYGCNPPPNVITNNSTDVTISSAILNGTINPNGIETNSYFEWGTDNTLSSFVTTNPIAIGSGTEDVSVSFEFIELNSNTTYFFRAVGENSSGTERGEILNFTTPSLQQGIQMIIALVNQYVSTGILNDGNGKALKAPLNAALNQINNGNTTAAVNQLNAFIKQVNAFINSGRLTPEQGQSFINSANEVISKLNNLNKQGIEISELPTEHRMLQNHPNPFNPSTVIRYSLPVNQHVLLRVYDVLGREVATLVDEFQEAGHYEANFDASHLASGLYFYKIDAGEFTAVKKMILTK